MDSRVFSVISMTSKNEKNKKVRNLFLKRKIQEESELFAKQKGKSFNEKDS